MRERPLSALLVVFMWTVIVVFWVAGVRADWSPDFSAQPLPASIVRSDNPAAVEGARLFHEKGCEFCHAYAGQGGKRGPDLTAVGGRMTVEQIALRITNGSENMPAYARTLTPQQVDALVAFLSTRTR